MNEKLLTAVDAAKLDEESRYIFDVLTSLRALANYYGEDESKKDVVSKLNKFAKYVDTMFH